MEILNLTQHPATQEQKAAGVVDLQGDELETLKELLTFEGIPTRAEIEDRAADIANLVMMNGLGEENDDPIFNSAMIGGAPYLMPALEMALDEHCINPLYAFSRRESVEQVQPDGSVRKTAVFRHIGFVGAY